MWLFRSRGLPTLLWQRARRHAAQGNCNCFKLNVKLHLCGRLALSATRPTLKLSFICESPSAEKRLDSLQQVEACAPPHGGPL